MAITAHAQTAGLASVRVYKFGGRSTQQANYDNLPDGYGSGWLITKTQVITAYHVVHNNRGGDKPLQVRFADGWRSWATVIDVDIENDIALLWVNPHETIEPIPLGTIPDRGKRIAIHGYGYDYEFATHFGQIVNRMRNSVIPDNFRGDREAYLLANYANMNGTADTDDEGNWQAVYVVSTPGDSGGPVTYNGKAIGCVLSITDTHSIIARIDYIQERFGDKLKHSVLRIK